VDNRRIKSFAIALLLFFAGNSFSQRILNLNAFASGPDVVIRFTIGKGSTCNGYNILHSTDSVFYNTIYNYPGICGNTSNDESISYTHKNPTANLTHFYKVELIPIETSPPIKFYVGSENYSKMVAYPNPLGNYIDQLNLQIVNSASTDFVGFLYNQYGKPLKYLNLKLNGSIATIGTNELNNGLYIVWLTDGERGYSAKFIVNR
jgi:hypothetical protein